MSQRATKTVSYKEYSSSSDDEPLVPSAPARKATKAKRVVDSDSDSSDDEPLVVPTRKKKPSKPRPKASSKKPAKEKASRKRKKAAPKSSKKTTRKRKVYEKPGQRTETKPELDSTRMFYESLYKENPNCEMAIKYLLYTGVFDKAEAAKWDKKLEGQDRRHYNQTMYKNMKRPAPPKRKTAVKREPVKKRKRVAKVEDSESSSDDAPLVPRVKANPPPKRAKVEPASPKTANKPAAKKTRATLVDDDSSSDDEPLVFLAKTT